MQWRSQVTDDAQALHVLLYTFRGDTRGMHFRATQVGPEAISKPFEMPSVGLNWEQF